MAVFTDEIPSETLMNWIRAQHMFFVATAPLSGTGHVNVSPKGYSGTFNLVSPTQCWYLDLTGSGNETISHAYEKGNGRITIMFMNFDGMARIVRLFGKAKILVCDTPEFDALMPPGDERRLIGARSIVYVDIHMVGTSCGKTVPYYSYQSDRMDLINWATKHPNLDLYRLEKNSVSLDGLPGVGASESRAGSRLLLKTRDVVKDRSFSFGVCVGVASGILLGIMIASRSRTALGYL